MYSNSHASTVRSKQRLTQFDKDKHDKRWYKQQADALDQRSFSHNHFFGDYGISEYKRKKVNYDLFNNIINQSDFEYVCKPFGAEAGELPARMTNRDIVSGKIKVLLGMEMSMPFSWRVIATNEEATTRKEQQEFNMIRDFVISEIMRPIQEQNELEARRNLGGRKLTPEEEDQIRMEIAEKTRAKTPDEVRKYMAREHQDPAELLHHQILEYLIQKERIPEKFNKGWKHLMLGGESIYYVGAVNGEPVLKVVNPLYFDYDKAKDLDYIEDGEWAVCEYRMSPSEVVTIFHNELSEAQIDRIYDYNSNPGAISDEDFTFSDAEHEPFTIRILHCTWKALRKIGFLSYVDANTGNIETTIVDENYRKNKDQGDLAIEWEWIPETHECYKIMDNIYCFMRPVPGQFKDLDNLYNCKLPYYGAAVDNLNSPITAPMDRIKAYQYYYNIILYRIELLMASDKGKILAANIKSIPKSAGIDTKKFIYFMEANKLAFVNPNEEGNRVGNPDVGSMLDVLDMSLVSDIAKYIELAEYIERKCGSAIGVTPQMEAQIQKGEAVSNTRQNIVQSTHIVRPYFELHNSVKRNVLQGLIETAKVTYSESKPRKLAYILDDMSMRIITAEQLAYLDADTVGVFVANASKAHDAKQAVEQLAQAALQNQQADLSDIIKVIRSNSVTEAEELLDAAQARKADQLQAMEREKLAQQERMMRMQSAARREDHEFTLEEIRVKEQERRETEIQKQTIFSMGFDPNKDQDNDGTPDILEVAKFGVDADIKRRKQKLDEDRFEHEKGQDEIEQENTKKKLELESKKIAAQKARKTAPK